jgi:hypothetical protein
MADQNPPPIPDPAPAILAIPAILADVANTLLALAQAMAANNANITVILTVLTPNAINIPAVNVGAAAVAPAANSTDPIFELAPLTFLYPNRLHMLYKRLC